MSQYSALENIKMYNIWTALPALKLKLFQSFKLQVKFIVEYIYVIIRIYLELWRHLLSIYSGIHLRIPIKPPERTHTPTRITTHTQQLKFSISFNWKRKTEKLSNKVSAVASFISLTVFVVFSSSSASSCSTSLFAFLSQICLFEVSTNGKAEVCRLLPLPPCLWLHPTLPRADPYFTPLKLPVNLHWGRSFTPN